MLRALNLAKTAASFGEVPVGAVIYQTATGQILAEGFNRREIDADPLAHAETITISAAVTVTVPACSILIWISVWRSILSWSIVISFAATVFTGVVFKFFG